LRTQQILAYETGVTNVVDPLGGSYYVEALTKEYERRIEEAIGKIDGIGGAVKAIEDGFMQEAIANEAYRLMREEKTGDRVVVGMNKFVAEDEKQEKREMRFHETDPLVRQRQIDRLDQVRDERDDNAVRDCLAELKEKARGKENLIPHLIRTVKTYASIEEIMDALKEVFGTFREPVNI